MENKPSRDQQRLLWACRRGTLELDLLLTNYLTNFYPQSSSDEQLDFQRLLACPDEDLSRYLINRQQPESPRLQAIVNKILANA